MTGKIIDSVLTKISQKMAVVKRNVSLFMDNDPCHPENSVVSYLNMKVVFLPTNTTSRLQSLDAVIIRNFKVKYQKRLSKFVISRIDDNSKAFVFIQEVDDHSRIIKERDQERDFLD